PIKACAQHRVDRLSRRVEDLAERCMGSAVVAVVDVGVGEEEGEPDLVEMVSTRPRLGEEAVEEGEGLVEAALARVAATEGVCSRRRVARCELAGIEGLLQQGYPLGDLAAAQRQPTKPEPRSGERCRRVSLRARRFVQ